MDSERDRNRNSLTGIYDHRFSEVDREKKARVWQVVVEDYFQRFVTPHDTVLDIGCGFGEFLNHLRCKRRIGIDANPDGARYVAPGVEFRQGDVRDLGFIGDGEVDVVFTSNLLEHLETKREVDRLVDEARRVLRKGGQLILLGPNARIVGGAYWDFWDHHLPITDRALLELMASHGFDTVEHHARFLPYTTRSRIPQAPFLVRWYLRVPLAWRLLGGQFLVRAVKP